MVGGLSSTPVIFEYTSRMIEYNLFTIPRVIEGFWDLGAKLNIIDKFNNYRVIIFGVFMAIGLYMNKYYVNYFPAKYKSIFNFIFGKQEEELKEDQRSGSNTGNLENIEGIKCISTLVGNNEV